MENVLRINSFILLFVISWSTPHCQNLYFNIGTGVSVLHAEKIANPFDPKLNYIIGLSFDGDKKISGSFGVFLENKGATNKYNNWKINLNYLSGAVGVKYNLHNKWSVSSGGYASVILSKKIQSVNPIHSSNINTFWNKYDAGIWFEGTMRTGFISGVHDEDKITLYLFLRTQYGVLNTLERWSALLTSQGNWIRNVYLDFGVKIKIP